MCDGVKANRNGYKKRTFVGVRVWMDVDVWMDKRVNSSRVTMKYTGCAEREIESVRMYQ